MKITVQLSYTIYSTTTIELPEGKTWDDALDHYVKWGTLYVRFKGSDGYTELKTDYADMESGDFKRPDRTLIWATDENGETDYETCLEDVA